MFSAARTIRPPRATMMATAMLINMVARPRRCMPWSSTVLNRNDGMRTMIHFISVTRGATGPRVAWAKNDVTEWP